MPPGFNLVLEALIQASSSEKELKGIQFEKEDATLSPFTDHMMMFAENSKESTKKKLELKWVHQVYKIQDQCVQINRISLTCHEQPKNYSKTVILFPI